MTDPVIDPKLERRKVDFVAILTLLTMLFLFTVTLMALYKGQLTFKELAAYTSPMVTYLLGYWVRGTTATTTP